VEATSTHQPNTRTHGVPVTRRFGALDITATRPTGGYAVRVAFADGPEIPELAFTSTDRDAYRTRYRYIAERALAGVKAETIAAEVATLYAAAQTIINVDVSNTQATPAGNDGNDLSGEVNAQAEDVSSARVNPFAALKVTFAPLRRDTRTPKAGVTAVTGPQQRVLAIAAARPSGIVNRGRGEATVTQLMALDAKGLVDLTRDNSRRGYITGAVITGAGRRHLASTDTETVCPA